ncbi:MAG: hypothetical protein AABX28_01035 [Nanoarchaeota archaeon]
MARNKKQKINPDNIINSAIQEGISAIVEHHPRFAEFQSYIAKHIDRKKLRGKINEIYEGIESEDLSDEQKARCVHKEIADYIATGAAFDETGQKVILRKGLEEKAKKEGILNFFSRRRARQGLEGEKYLDNTLGAFQDLYDLFKSGDYAQRMPELREAVTSLNDMNFLNPALDILRHNNMIDEGRYRSLKKEVMDRTRKESERVSYGIEKYLTPQKLAASIFGIFGIGLLVSSGMKITGNVIGNVNANLPGTLAGIILLVVSLILFLTSKKKF